MITIKDEREIDLMRHAGHVVGLVHQELAKWLKPGLTTEQVSDFCDPHTPQQVDDSPTRFRAEPIMPELFANAVPQIIAIVTAHMNATNS